jgi:hypothetical protein
MTSAARIEEVTANATRLRSAGVRLALAATGAGAGIQEVLWRVPGCSSFLVGAAFPYDASETEEFLCFRPEHFASEETAIDLASAAYVRAVDPQAFAGGARPIGLGVTASVATTKAHRGEHRFHVAAVTANLVVGRTVVLPKGVGAERRRLDGDTVDEVALQVLFDVAGIARDPALEDWSARAWTQFFARPYWDAGGKRHAASALPEGAALFPGAFDPPHEGHLALARETGTPLPAVFAICATPPHKSALSVGDMLRRAKLLRGKARLFTEGDPLYLDKARRFPGRTFLLGSDALLRMLDARWGTEVEPMLAELARLGTRFRVSARVVDGVLVTPEEGITGVAPRYRELFVSVPGRWDVSSSELRERG